MILTEDAKDWAAWTESRRYAVSSVEMENKLRVVVAQKDTIVAKVYGSLDFPTLGWKKTTLSALARDAFAGVIEGMDQASEGAPPPPTAVHVLAIGANTEGRRYAEQDALNMAAWWSAQAGTSLYPGGVTAQPLTGAKATRAAIIHEIYDLAARAEPGSMVVLYLSGHGDLSPDPNNRLYYYVPYGERTDSLLANLISASDLLNPLRALPERGVKVLVLADTCFSGSLAEELKQLKGATEDFLNARSKLVVLASAAPTAASRELPDKKSGAFTWALLQELQRGTWGGDNVLSWQELVVSAQTSLKAQYEQDGFFQAPTLGGDGAIGDWPIAVREVVPP